MSRKVKNSAVATGGAAASKIQKKQSIPFQTEEEELAFWDEHEPWEFIEGVVEDMQWELDKAKPKLKRRSTTRKRRAVN